MGGDSTRGVPETSYVLKYDHKHGTDLSAYLSEEDAEIGAAHLMLEWISDLCDGEANPTADEILDHIEKGEVGNAIAKWPELASDTESLSIEEVKLYPNPPEVTPEDVEAVREAIAPSGDEGE